MDELEDVNATAGRAGVNNNGVDHVAKLVCANKIRVEVKQCD